MTTLDWITTLDAAIALTFGFLCYMIGRTNGALAEKARIARRIAELPKDADDRPRVPFTFPDIGDYGRRTK